MAFLPWLEECNYEPEQSERSSHVNHWRHEDDASRRASSAAARRCAVWLQCGDGRSAAKSAENQPDQRADPVDWGRRNRERGAGAVDSRTFEPCQRRIRESELRSDSGKLAGK